MSSYNGRDPQTTAVIVSAVRTPIGRFLGGLAPLSAPKLGALAVRTALERSGVPAEHVDEVILGNVVQAGVGQAPARQAAVLGGVPTSVPALTVNKVCGSGLKAVMLAAQAIRAGDARALVAGGMESMSNAPHRVRAVAVSAVCDMGLRAGGRAVQAIRAGDARALVPGGMESMANAPHLVRGLRDGIKFGNQPLIDGLIHDGLWCSFGECHMGGHA